MRHNASHKSKLQNILRRNDYTHLKETQCRHNGRAHPNKTKETQLSGIKYNLIKKKKTKKGVHAAIKKEEHNRY